jgi:hypothetical protein
LQAAGWEIHPPSGKSFVIPTSAPLKRPKPSE